MKLAFTLVVAILFSIQAKAEEVGKEVILSSDVMDNLSLEVPKKKMWHIVWKNPKCDGFCSYDIAVEGWLFLGENKKYLTRNTRIRLANSPLGQMWVKPSSLVTIQIDPKLVSVVEYSYP